jgi:hypothetical protein
VKEPVLKNLNKDTPDMEKNCKNEIAASTYEEGATNAIKTNKALQNTSNGRNIWRDSCGCQGQGKKTKN